VTTVDTRRACYENPFPDSISAHLTFESGAHGRAAVDWISPGRHRFEIRSVGIRATSLAGFGSTEIAARGRAIERLDPDEDDQRFKPGFWKQDSAFLAAVRAGRPPAWPAPSLADAHASMAMIDSICGLSPEVGADEPS
jgi:predicted dehydrogenase